VIYDPLRDRAIIFGGYSAGVMNDAWALALGGATSWSMLNPVGGLAPPARSVHTAIYDAANDRMVIFGGFDGSGPNLNDTWALTLSTPAWSELDPGTGPSSRTAMSAIYDAPRARMLMFGGYPNGPDLDDLWSLTLGGTPAWTLLAPAGQTPVGRQDQGAVYDPVRDRMLMYGGIDAVRGYNEVWAFTPGSTTSVPVAQGGRGSEVALGAPRPNPSRGTSALEFLLVSPGHATLEIFDAGGRRVRRLVDANLSAGPHSASWSGEDDRGGRVANGLYFVRLRSGTRQVTRRLVRID
jgi:FlgD Ig-like domain/Galactose oxidase, central domain